MCQLLNFEYCDEIERLFEFAEDFIDKLFDSVDKTHKGCKCGIPIERVLCFGFKQRLLTILKNKNLFIAAENRINKKYKNINHNNKDKKDDNEQNENGQVVTGRDSGDEFEFENYLRLAFADWNCSLLALFQKRRAPFRLPSERSRIKAKLTLELV